MKEKKKECQKNEKTKSHQSNKHLGSPSPCKILRAILKMDKGSEMTCMCQERKKVEDLQV